MQNRTLLQTSNFTRDFEQKYPFKRTNSKLHMHKLQNLSLLPRLTETLSLIFQFESLTLIATVRREVDKQLIVCGVHGRDGAASTKTSIPSCRHQRWGSII